jgi:hypothetical protein
MHGRNSHLMLIVGTNPRAIEFARTGVVLAAGSISMA